MVMPSVVLLPPTVDPTAAETTADLLHLATELADKELRPRADDFEARGEFPREVVRTLGRSGFLGLPYSAEFGCFDLPYEVYLQVLEIFASRWLGGAEGVSGHTLARYPLAAYGSPPAPPPPAASDKR